MTSTSKLSVASLCIEYRRSKDAALDTVDTLPTASAVEDLFNNDWYH
jgi:hypothetical protein